MLNEKEIVEKLIPLSDVSIIYSKHTSKFYVSLNNVEIKKEGMLHSPCFHCDTPLEALQTTFTALMIADLIVKNAYGTNREEIKWDTDHFEQINN